MEHKNLELWRWIFTQADSWTAESRLMNRRLIFTADPENIKAILATQFGDFGKGQPFHEEWKDFLGDSIFTTDGDLWHGSRQLIRPQFIKDRVSDLHCFELHMETLFRAMANGGALNGENQHVDLEKGSGRVLDISDLFFRYTLDCATDFLLGKDVKSLRCAITFTFILFLSDVTLTSYDVAPLASRSPRPSPRRSVSRTSSRGRDRPSRPSSPRNRSARA